MDRLGLSADRRILLAGLLAGTVGFLHGTTTGAKFAALRYLAENAHRLPRTQGTWYFFHKRRNAVVIKEGINAGIVRGLKFTIMATMFVATEAAVDHARNKVSWVGTASAAALTGFVANAWSAIPMKHTLRSTGNCLAVGIAIGLAQDGVRMLEEMYPKSAQPSEETIQHENVKHQ